MMEYKDEKMEKRSGVDFFIGMFWATVFSLLIWSIIGIILYFIFA